MYATFDLWVCLWFWGWESLQRVGGYGKPGPVNLFSSVKWDSLVNNFGKRLKKKKLGNFSHLPTHPPKFVNSNPHSHFCFLSCLFFCLPILEVKKSGLKLKRKNYHKVFKSLNIIFPPFFFLLGKNFSLLTFCIVL